MGTASRRVLDLALPKGQGFPGTLKQEGCTASCRKCRNASAAYMGGKHLNFGAAFWNATLHRFESSPDSWTQHM